jgi:hypothetical protein
MPGFMKLADSEVEGLARVASERAKNTPNTVEIRISARFLLETKRGRTLRDEILLNTLPDDLTSGFVQFIEDVISLEFFHTFDPIVRLRSDNGDTRGTGSCGEFR